MAYSTIIVDLKDGVCTIRLNRPEVRNAINALMMRELASAIRSAESDPTTRCILLTGSDKAFAAGADIKEMASKSFVEVFGEEFVGADFDAIARARKPIIAAVAGYALGGGCELAMLADFIIAADNARFGQPEVNLGVMAGLGGTQRLTRAVGKAKAMDMHLTGRLMEAEEAERAGLVARVVPLARLMEEATSAARKIAAKSPISVMAIKESVNCSQESGLREGQQFERRLFQALFATEDQKEGMAAFVEKREPQFRGR